MFKPRQITAADIRAYRDETGASLVGAQSHLRRLALENALSRVRALGTIEDKVEFLLNRFEEDLNRG